MIMVIGMVVVLMIVVVVERMMIFTIMMMIILIRMTMITIKNMITTLSDCGGYGGCVDVGVGGLMLW